LTAFYHYVVREVLNDYFYFFAARKRDPISVERTAFLHLIQEMVVILPARFSTTILRAMLR
tara:strand:- start:1342 stop:1524 length:183 start_codon:yes stop_codon:yes gene_type:complete